MRMPERIPAKESEPHGPCQGDPQGGIHLSLSLHLTKFLHLAFLEVGDQTGSAENLQDTRKVASILTIRCAADDGSRAMISNRGRRSTATGRQDPGRPLGHRTIVPDPSDARRMVGRADPRPRDNEAAIPPQQRETAPGAFGREGRHREVESEGDGENVSENDR